jgi:hypothetical protein
LQSSLRQALWVKCASIQWSTPLQIIELAQGRIAHAEARPHVLGEQSNRMTVSDRIHTRQIAHGLNQDALSVHISRIRGPLPWFLAAEIGHNWDSKNFGHDAPMLFVGTLAVRLDGVFEYNAACCSMQPEFSGVS